MNNIENSLMEKPLTIYELTLQIKNLLEDSFPVVYVVGEISNYKRHSSGHIYLTLKDDKSQIQAVIWRSTAQNIKFNLENGLKVNVFGKLAVYEKGGNYQIIISSLMPAGLGELQLAFEQLKKKLEQEGLFDEKFKKPIPAFPEIIGVVTSRTGAAIRDIIKVLRRRYPSVDIILRPVRVQGDTAAAEIAQAIKEFNEYGKVDVLIVGRGGGSLEDLWAFNEEIVARAIFESKIPIISAVGHEIDFTIADFVADIRAATPSAAAEIAVKDIKELENKVILMKQKLVVTMISIYNNYKQRYKRAKRILNYERMIDLLNQKIQYIDSLTSRLKNNFENKVELKKQHVISLKRHLEALNPKNILDRGYSITLSLDDKIINSKNNINKNMKIKTIVKDGDFTSIIE